MRATASRLAGGCFGSTEPRMRTSEATVDGIDYNRGPAILIIERAITDDITLRICVGTIACYVITQGIE